MEMFWVLGCGLYGECLDGHCCLVDCVEGMEEKRGCSIALRDRNLVDKINFSILALYGVFHSYHEYIFIDIRESNISMVMCQITL